MSYIVSDKTKKWISDNSTKIEGKYAQQNSYEDEKNREKTEGTVSAVINNIFGIVSGSYGGYSFNNISQLEDLSYIGIDLFSNTTITYNGKDIKVPKYVWKDYAEYVISNSTKFDDNIVYQASSYITGQIGLDDAILKKYSDAILETTDGKTQKTQQQISEEKLTKCLTELQNINTNGIGYTPFVVLKLIGYKYSGNKRIINSQTVIDSRDTNQAISTYFNYKRNGTGQANEFEIAVCFSPHERAKSLLDEKNQINPNTLESILTQICIASKQGTDDNKNKNSIMESEDSDEQEFDLDDLRATLWSCKLQVGYTVDGQDSIISPEYNTLVTDYKYEFIENQLVYTIQGVSSVMELATMDKFKHRAFACTEEPIASALEVFLQQLDENNELNKFKVACGNLPDGNPIFTKLDIEHVFNSQNINSPISCKCTKNFRDTAKYELYNPKESKNNNVSTDNEIDFEKIMENGIPKSNKDMSLFGNLEELLSFATLRNSYLKNYSGKFDYTILDSSKDNYDSILYITFNEYSKGFEDETVKDSVFTFRWLDTPTPHSIVKNFQVNESGAYIKAAINTKTKALMEELYFVDNEGKSYLLSDTDDITTESGEFAPWYNIIKESIYKKALRNLGNYKASLTLIGVPAEILILSTIKIEVYMDGMEHFSSGYYRVISIQDTFDTSGYQTTLELLKITEKTDIDKLAKDLKLLIQSSYKNSKVLTNEELSEDQIINSSKDYYTKVKKSSKLTKYWKKQYEKYKKDEKEKKKSDRTNFTYRQFIGSEYNFASASDSDDVKIITEKDLDSNGNIKKKK